MQAAHFIAPGIAMPFFPLWLASQGLTAGMVGFILALPTFLRILTTPLITRLTDHKIAPAPLLLMIDCVLIGLYVCLFVPTNVIGLTILCALIGILHAVTIPIGDAMTLNALREHPHVPYGRVRLWGSLSFLISTLLVGMMLTLQNQTPVSYVLIPALLAFAYVISAITAYASPLAGYQLLAQNRSAEVETHHDTLQNQLQDRHDKTREAYVLWLMISSVALIQASHAAVYHFGSLYWQQKGASSSLISLFWIGGVVSEIAVFWALSTRWQRPNKAFLLLLIGCLCAIIRFCVMAFNPDLNAYYLLQMLHAGSFGATHLASMALISYLAPVNKRGQIQGYNAAFTAFAMGCSTLASGYIYERYGSHVFILMSVLALIGLILALFAWRIFRLNTPESYPHNAGSGG